MKLLLVLLLAGSICWDVASAHRRHPPRLQRMAPRPHPRPPRHHPPHSHSHSHSPHPNMIQIPQHSQHASHRPHRSYKPRLHIPLLSGLHHRHPLRGHHPHHPHHNHNHHGPHHHPPHGHHHHHHSHGPHHHHNAPHAPHHHPRQQGQQQAAPQQLRLPQQNQLAANGFPKPQGPIFGPGFPGDAPQAHTSPASAPKQQHRQQFPSHPPPPPPPQFFQQDEIPFNEPSEHPSTHGGFPTQASLPKLPPQHTTAVYGPSALGDNSPHGYLSSTYKGWKPIVKPFQSSYPRSQEGQQQHGPPEFQRGPPIQEFSDNHLPAFPQIPDNHPLPDFPGSGPSGPQHHNNLQGFPSGPQHSNNNNNNINNINNVASQDYSGGPPESLMEGFPHIPDPPQIPDFARAPAAHQNNNQLLEFPQQDQDSHMQQFNGQHQHQHGPPRHQQHHNQHHRHQHHPPGKGIFHQPQLNQDFGNNDPSSTPKDDFQFLPTGGASSPDSFSNLNTNTLFRENILHMKPHNNRQNVINNQHQAHAPNSNDVEIPLPPEIGDSVRLPNSLFTDNSWNQQNGRQPFETSQSEENIVVKKPKFPGKLKLNRPPGSEEGVEPPPSVFPKFKPGRPRLNKNSHNNNEQDKQLGSSSLQDQEPEIDGPPKVSLGSDEGPPPLGLKHKLNGGRGRVRIRTRLRRPNPFGSNSGEEGNSGGDGSGSSSSPRTKPFPPFPGKSDSPRRPIFRKQPTNNPPPDNNLSTESPGPNGPGPGGDNNGGGSGSPGNENEIKNSEEVGQLGPLPPFPNIPFPPSEADIFREFPGAGPQKEPEVIREREPRPHPPSRPPLGGRGPNTISSSSGSVEQTESHRQRQANNQDSSPPPRAHIGVRRRRPKHQQQQQQQQEQQQQHRNNHNNKQQQQDDDDKEQPNKNTADNPQTTPPVILNETPLFSDEFFFPPGFNQDPTKHQGENPVSFITMPNAKPHVIHHDVFNQQPQSQEHVGQLPQLPHQHQAPLHQQTSPQTSHHPQNIFHGNNFRQQDFPLDQGRTQNYPINNPPPPPYARHPQHQLPSPPSHQQLSAYSDLLPFTRPPRGRPPKPHRGPPPAKPPHNPYNFPASNPYASPPVVGGGGPPPDNRKHGSAYNMHPTGSRIPHRNPNELNYDALDNAPQTSNSYEVPDAAYGTRQPPVLNSHPPGPSHHHQSGPPPPPNGLHIPQPSPLPPPRNLPAPSPTLLLPAAGPGRGRHPGRGVAHRQKPVMAPIDAGLSQSVEFEQIPAQYVENLPLNPDVTFPTSSVAPVPIPATPQARPVYTKPHVHHSPDIHPPGSFFDDFFKPFDDAFVQKQGAATQRVDDPNGDRQDEQQSQSNVRLNVVPSPKNMTALHGSGGGDGEEGGRHEARKHWSKLKSKDDKAAAAAAAVATGDSAEVGKGRGKKPIGRFNNNKNHLKAKIADIARKNFESHLKAEVAEKGDGPVTTYKPSLANSTDDETPQRTKPLKETTLKVIPTWNADDDAVDTNIPKSVRFSSKTDGGPILIRGRSQDPHDPNHTTDGTTILFKSKRQFRRKRPGQKKPFPLTSDGEEELEPVASRSVRPPAEDHTPIPHSDEEGGSRDGETTRVGVLRRRKLFPRRRNFSLSKSKDAAVKDSTTTPEVGEAEPVTYGESQWFRVKKYESHEADSGKGGEATAALSTPVPTPESKTASNSDSPPVVVGVGEGGSSSSSSSKLKKAHSQSDHPNTTPKDEHRPFGKKSSKFLMNRLPVHQK